MRSLVALAALTLFAACQPAAQADQEADETVTAEAPLDNPPETIEPVVEVAPAADTTPFAVHEWGLIRIGSDGAELATSAFDARPEVIDALPQQPIVTPPGPNHPVRPAPTPERLDRPRKPIVYLHALDGFDGTTAITVQVGIAAGTLHEVWPVATLGNPLGATHTFGPLTITPNVGCDTAQVPTIESPFCAMVTAGGGVCETAEMREYLLPVPHCLQTPAGPAPVLLYNGLFTSNVTPVEVTYDSASVTATVTNTGGLAVGPLWAVSLDANEGTGRHYHRIDRLEPGASQQLSPTAHTFGENDHEALIADILASLLAQGLTQNEAADFVAAWRPDVLAPRAADNIIATTPWTAFGFYGSEFIEATLPMTVTPTPAESVRVLAFSLE